MTGLFWFTATHKDMDMSKIYAVVLTFNRRELLKRCLEAIYAQTRPCDGVIVIDNASTDGTEDVLLQERYPFLQVYSLSDNIGASGGFNAGFRIAYQSGADLIWMMDDDVIAEPDALLKLEEADGLLHRKGIDHAYVLSTAFTEEGVVTNSPHLDERLNTARYQNWPLTLEHGMVPVRRATFVSILVPRAMLSEYGLPLAPMFIWGEDSEFTLRITQKAPGFLVGASKVRHIRQQCGSIDILSENNPSRVGYLRHLVRNELFVARRYYTRRQALMTTLFQWKILFKLLRLGAFGKAMVVMRGLRENVGFNPASEAADTPLQSLGVTARFYSPAGDTINYVPLQAEDTARATERPALVIPEHGSAHIPTH